MSLSLGRARALARALARSLAHGRSNESSARSPLWRAALPTLLLFAQASCYTPPEPERFAAELEIVDESGAPVASATVDLGSGEPRRSDENGRVRVTGLEGPVLAVIEADGFLAEPVPLGRMDSEGTVRVRLLSDGGGTRWVMHSAGDVMLGRRYETPEEGESLVPASDPASGARRVVEHVQRAFAAADLGTVNLETVIGELPETAAYPAKRSVLQSQPEALAGLTAMGVDLAVLANNHSRDYLDPGIASTMAALEAAAIDHVGAAASSAAQADAPRILVTAGGVRVGVLAWTTVTGAAANDDLPGDGMPVPVDAPPSTLWQYETRTWGYEGPTWSIPAVPRRIGTAWGMFASAEPLLSANEAADAWASLIAVYPELQDLVAGRGHGGAAAWRTDEATDAIAALASSVDVVIVQLHGGLALQPAPSELVRQIARDAIDAGAHLVVGHHPHVQQGAEWYKGRLIAYSLGNLLSDKDLFDTLSSAFLRTVWEGSTLLEARFVLFELEGYRPIPVTDAAARRAALAIWERSQLAAQAAVDSTGQVRVFGIELDADTRPASVAMRHHDALLLDTPPRAEDVTVEVPANQTVALGYDGLIVPAEADAAQLWFGRDLFGWGSFEDQLADGQARGDTEWRVDSAAEEVIVDETAGQGVAYVELRRTSQSTQGVTVQRVSRVALPEHRLYRDINGTAAPADGVPRYSVRFLARRGGEGEPFLRLEMYQGRRDSEGERTLSTLVAKGDLPIGVPADEAWHVVEIELPESFVTRNDLRANEIMLALRLTPPGSGRAYFDVDDMALIEWRRAADLLDRPGAYGFVRNDGAQPLSLVLTGLPLQASRPGAEPAPGAPSSR